MVTEGPGSSGTRIINTNYPDEYGLTAGTTKQGPDSPSLEPEVRLVQNSWGCA